MQAIDNIYYINLARRQDRKSHFLSQCTKHQIEQTRVERFEAFDGRNHQFPQSTLQLFRNADYLQYPYRSAVICNQMSHFTILKQMIEKNQKYILVFQDDAKLKDGFTEYIDNIMGNLPDDAEMVNLGMHEYAMYSHFVPWNLDSKNDDNRIAEEVVNPYICKLNHDCNPCSLAYIMTLKGAKNMVEYFSKHGFRKCTDHAYNDYLKQRDIFYSSRNILVTSAVEFGSDVFPV
jgi:GR25 family glycosyltransferase involved in LPS biosynthesis